MDQTATRQTVRQFITENFYVANPAELTDDTLLLDQGIIDSTGVVEIISFIEDTFHITVDDAEMVPHNLNSVACIAAFVARKL